MKKYIVASLFLSLCFATPAHASVSSVIQSAFSFFLPKTTSSQSDQSAAVVGTVADIDPNQSNSCADLSLDLRYRQRDTANNDDIATLQDFLQSAGYLKSEPTGYFGLMTFQAVKDFQRAQNISPTGYVGPYTRGKIKAISCGTSTTTPITTNPVQPVSPRQASIIVLSPNGGETYTAGDTVSLSFKTSLTDKQTSGITIQLYSSSGGYVQDIVKKWTGGSPYSWSIPLNLSGSYKIYITGEDLRNVTGKELYDFSDGYFRIISPVSVQTPSITVVSPNGGETLVAGQAYTVTWRTSNYTQPIRIEATGEAKENYSIIADNYPVTSGRYVWNIPSSLPAGLWKIRILGASGVNDTSDSYFTLSAPVVSVPPVITRAVAPASEDGEIYSNQRFEVEGRNLAGNSTASTLVYFINPSQPGTRYPAQITQLGESLIWAVAPGLVQGTSYSLFVSNEDGTSQAFSVRIPGVVVATPPVITRAASLAADDREIFSTERFFVSGSNLVSTSNSDQGVSVYFAYLDRPSQKYPAQITQYGSDSLWAVAPVLTAGTSTLFVQTNNGTSNAYIVIVRGSGSTSAQSITIANPPANQQIGYDIPYTFRWTTSVGLSSDASLSIDLIDTSGVSHRVVQDIPNTGSYDLTVTSTDFKGIPLGFGPYTIKMCTMKDQSICGTQNNFSLSNKG